jgi:hypothetical protein
MGGKRKRKSRKKINYNCDADEEEDDPETLQRVAASSTFVGGIVHTPHEHDVLLGKGQPIISRNKETVWREMVELNKLRYWEAKSNKKREIAMKIVE